MPTRKQTAKSALLFIYVYLPHMRVHRRCRRFVSRDLDEMIRVKSVYTLNHYNKQRTKNPINGLF